MNDAAERERLAQALTDYDIGRVLGRGQFGVVWSGRHLHLSREVAIKRLDDLMAADAEQAARFRREARTLANLDHRHVVTVHDYREVDGMRFLIMEILQGGTLADRRAGGMPIETSIAATLAAASGLHNVHESGVLHRDIKPENLMFDSVGVLKVTDFGLARGDGNRDTAIEVTQAGTFFGTPAYVAPEQAAAALAEGWPEVGRAADQYSLAAVLYESLSGQLTHDTAGGGVALCTRRMNEEARPLEVFAPDTPPAVAAVIMQALARDPAQRYSSTEAFAVALGEAATSSLEPGWLGRSDVAIRESGPILESATSRSGSASPAPTATRTPPSPPADRPPVTPAAPIPPRRRRGAVVAASIAVAVVAVVGTVLFLARDSSTDETTTTTPSTTETGPPAPTFDVAEVWSAATGDDVFASPALTEDLVIIGSADGSLYGLDRVSGAQRWEYATGGAVDSTAAIDGTRAIVGSKDGSVHAVDTTSGAKAWATPLGYEIVSSPAVGNGLVLIGADKLYALDAASGAERWSFATDSVVVSSPAVDGSTVVVASLAGTLYAVDSATGTQRWKVDLAGEVQSSPRISEGVIYVGTNEGDVHAIRLADGGESWSTPVGSAVRSSPLIASGQVMTGTQEGHLVALDVTTGALVWTWESTKSIDSSPALGEGWVAVGSNDNLIHLIDPTNGTEVGRFATGGPVLSSPRVAGDELFVGSYDDKVYALKATPQP